ncbi:MAG: FG-GAP-like repeat-containing protein [Candidatus Gribaldobacteria bacterium]|nr:FG-GAP-like repeat-containing protein [Candidatus Gribaldobacteria bacterium]
MTSEEIKTNKYISLTEAAEKYTEYSQEYLSLRARQGKLKAVKIGRNWLTKKEWVEEYIAVFNGNGEVGGHALSDTKSSTEIIANSLRQKKSTATALKLFSLSELENYSGYSQEYLSLRARQGKLKAVKIGRNWLIAKEWIDEYKNNVDNKQKISQVFGAFLQQKIFSPAINLKNNFYSTLQLLKKQSAVLLAATILIFCSAGLVFGFPYINDLQQAAKKTALKSLQNVYEVSKEKANNDLSFFGEQLNTTTNDFTRFLGEQKFALQVIAQNEFQNFISSTSNFFQKEKQLVYADLVDTILATENIENYIEGKAGDFSRHDINKIIVSMAMVQKEFKEGVYQFFVHVSQVALDEAPKNYQVVNFLKKAPAIGKLFKQSFFVLQDVVRVEIKNRQYELERTFQESKLISDGWRVDVDFNKVKEVIVNEVYNQLSIFNDKNYVVSQALVFGEQEINKLFDQAAVDCQRFLAKARNDISLSFSAWIEQLNATGKIVLVTIDGLQANIENKVGNYWAAGQNNWQDNWRAVTAGVNQRGDQLANNIDNFSANLLENVQQGMAWLMIGSTNKADEFSLTFFQKIKFFTSLTSQSLRATSQIAWDSAQISGNAIGDKIVEGIGDAAGALRSLTYSIYNRTSEGLAKGYEFITMPWREKATQQLVKTAVVNAPVGQIIPTTTSAAEEMIAQLTPKELAPKEIISGIIEKGALSQNASINTIREIARIDESSLVLIRSQIAELQRNAAKAASVNDLEELRNLLTKIQATPPIYSIVSAAPAYIGSTGLQISGGTDFNTLGVSGLSGIRELSVGGSTTLGKTDSDFLTVNASAGFLADVTFNKDVDIAGDLTLNGLVFNTASGGAMVITSTSSPQLTVAYNSSHYFTTNVSSAGVSTLASVGVLNLTGNGISIKTDTTGDILLSSANNLFEKFATSSAYTLYQGETARLAINTAGDISLTGSTTITGNTVIVGNSTTTGNSVISGNLIVSGTSTLTVTSASQLVIAGNTYFSALTAGSVPFVGSGGLLSQNNSNLFWDSATARLGVGTTTPIAKLTVEGDTYFMGNATTTGNLFVGGSSVVFGASSSTNVIVNSAVASNLIPDQNALRNLGSAAYFWDNLYIDSIVANNMSVASTSIGGTNSNDFVINADNATADTETANLIFFRGTVVPNALLTWDSIADRFDFNQSILMQNDSSTTTVISLDVRGKAGQIADLFRVASSTETSFFNITSAGLVGIGTSTPTEKLEVAGNIKPETSFAYNLGTVSMDTTPDVTFNGLVQFDYLGYYNSLAHGDFNGDGYEDVLVSAKLAKGGGTQKGQAYIFYGGPTGPDNTADITFTGANNGDLLGTAVATGDVNGDGYMDAIVSAYAAAGGGSARGQIYVYYGGPAMDNVADVVINGSADGDQLARSLAVADVNGDGYQDIIAGALAEFLIAGG